MVPRILVFLLALGGILYGTPRPACAQDSGGAILVLGVANGQHHDERLTESLERYLGSTEQIIPSRSLRADERRCREPRCLYALAQRKGAAMLIGATTTLIGTGEVELAVYLLLCSSKTWRHAEVTVAADRLPGQLNELARKLMHGSVTEAPRARLLPGRTSRRQNVMEDLMKVLAALPERRGISPQLKSRLGVPLLVFSGVALGAASLISGLSPHYNTSARCFAGYHDVCPDHGTPLSIAGYAVAGGLALAGTITLALPSRLNGGR